MSGYQLLVLHETGVKPDPFVEINRRFAEEFLRLKTVNPRGYLDRFEEQIDIICDRIAEAMRPQYPVARYVPMEGDVLVFVFSPVTDQFVEKQVAKMLAKG